ncbi:cytoplasmic polyadenylation element-binding protein 2-like [Acanthaster planci]|uniref:Cytoplasmic polyadenylation element-binding protein 2-like n=1 Tax=Acanthaster planci TaxID=133434 RepID=A0A8B7YSM8_ACAPL|nr:cytoplasmic polyadenylation element-binding protein 2-like [Acanthaster planci]
MGDFGLDVHPHDTRALSPLELYPNSSTVSLFSPEALTMQDDMLMEKTASKQHLQQLSPNPDLSSDNSDDLSPGSKSKSGDSSPLTVPEKNKAQSEVAPTSTSSAASVGLLQLQQQIGYYAQAQVHAQAQAQQQQQQQQFIQDVNPSNYINNVASSGTSGSAVNSVASSSSFTSAPNLWSTATAAEESYFQGLPTMNGTMQFQNFPRNSSPLFSPNATLSPQLGMQQQQQAVQQRRSLPPHQAPTQQQNIYQTATQLQQAQAQLQAQAQAGSLYLQSKQYPANWNSAAAQQTAAATSWPSPQAHQQSMQPSVQQQQQQGNPWGTVGSPPSGQAPTMANNIQQQQRRSMPAVNNQSVTQPSISPQKGRVLSNPIISPPKFQRSTSLPAKNYGQYPSGINTAPSLEFTRADGKRTDANTNTLFPYQERAGQNTGVDPMKLSSLEHQLFDIMRGTENSMDHYTRNPYGLLDDGRHDQIVPSLSSPGHISPRSNPDYGIERFSRKVFVGGLPPDIDEEEITASFRRFGSLVVDWPHKAESKSYFPPKGYAFLLFQDERSVQALIEACIKEEDKLYLCVSSPTIKDKPVQIRPWNLADSDFVLDGSQPLDPRKTIFVGGVPRPLRAIELAMIMDRLYGGVCYAGIDTDPELKYPKGAGRVAFSNQQSYIAAISARFVQLQHGDIDKRVEVKPYVLDDQMCDECQGVRCGGKFAPFFCANVTCLQYYCDFCWAAIHARPGREFHKPLVKEGGDRPRSVPFRW